MEVALKNMLVSGVVNTLYDRLITQVTDETKANVVRAGRLQDDPTRGSGITMLVWPDEEAKPDELFTRALERHAGMNTPTFEISGDGGAAYYYRRLACHFLAHYRGFKTDDEREIAQQRSEVIMARARHAIVTMNMPLHPITLTTQDDFGETVVLSQVDSHWIKESGGPGNFIWKGEIHFGFLTVLEH